ncbi:hypothetical protein Aros01_05246 [Streptosporangium roseum]|uniref:Uncharacterized protein n=1 Tax=Streptosporangium roseum (strain ATCC 12428 / DSM 43021 / JCM 3005 / KCTC 9067 / NCIMB 10171 / NRRL 2505 / NI 9100) TaxID=479432 RepID=D2AYK5_STRRD|nr:hypothetical protein Sros_6263 [Streptosporangium roseum DSM 43021]
MVTLEERATRLENEFRALRTRCAPGTPARAREARDACPGQAPPERPGRAPDDRRQTRAAL